MTIKEIEELIRFVSKANVTEVELETKDIKIAIKTSKGGTERVYSEAPPVISQPLPVVQAAPKQTAAETQNSASPPAGQEVKGADDSKHDIIKSPMIGTFYRSGGPDKPPFVNVGDKIEKGKIICIIEAMKLFNEIEAEVSGTIVKVLINDASPVEYDQPLFSIDTSK